MIMKNKRPQNFLLAALLTFSLAACGDEHSHGVEDPAAEACEHLSGPATQVTAAVSPLGAPMVAADHKRYDVKLLDGVSGGKSGVIGVTIGQKGHLLVFLGRDVPVAISNAAGTAILGQRANAAPPCAQLKAAYEYEVTVGRHDITLGGPANAIETVGLVLETESH